MSARVLYLATALTLAVGTATATPARADDDRQLSVAVTTSFLATLRTLAPRFRDVTGIELVISSGATGALYSQIRSGAPFDVYLAADEARPHLLVDEGLAFADTRFTYAEGRLVLWSARPGFVDTDGQVLHTSKFRHLAIANPRTAPYGAAAIEVLDALGLHDALAPRLVTSENVGQAFQWVRTGTAPLGFVALSQVLAADGTIAGSHWLPPQTLHAPIRQQAVALRRSPREAAAREFLRWLRSPDTVARIRAAGYAIPDVTD